METKGLLEIIDKAIEREDKARLFYLDASGKTGDSRGKQMFQWLAGEEQKHYQKLSQQRKELSKGGKWQSQLSAQPPLTAADLPRMPEAAGEIKATSGEFEALQLGITAEKESIALYSKARALATAPEAKELFGRLADEESGHLLLLEEEYQWIKNSKEYFTLHRFSLPQR